MSIEQIKEIVNPLVIFLTSGTGAVVLGTVIKAIISAVSAYKQKKASKLSDADKSEIASEAAEAVISRLAGKLDIDITAEIDKSTNGRVRAVEEKTNELITQMNTVSAYTKAMMSAVGDFKTISQSSREKIQGLLGDDSSLRTGYIQAPVMPSIELKAITTTSDDVVEQRQSVSY